MDVAYATDNGYMKPTLVSMMSMLEHASKDIVFHVLGHRLSDEALKSLEAVCDLYPGTTVNHVPVTDRMVTFPNWNPGSEKLTRVSLARLHLPKILGSGRVLYLDGDTMVFGDIAPLFDLNMEGKAIAAVRENDTNLKMVFYGAEDPEAQEREILDGNPIRTYVNSGVLLMDIDAIIAEGLHKRMVDKKLMSKEWFLPVNSFVNFLFRGRIKYLGPEWNMMPMCGGDGFVTDFKPFLKSDLRIRHFTHDELKPWDRDLPEELFNDIDLHLGVARSLLEYRVRANELLERLFGDAADVMKDMVFGETGGESSAGSAKGGKAARGGESERPTAAKPTAGASGAEG